MALVDYTSSEDEDEEDVKSPNAALPASLKRKRNQSFSDLPPLPSKFHDLYASATRISTRDDPSLHGGRKRVTPHLEGNWPTHLYIEWCPSTKEYASLTSLISVLADAVPLEKTKAQSLLISDLGSPLPLHVSLSRPIGFLREQKDNFVTSLERNITLSGIRPFEITFSSMHWIPNFEKTRWFLVLRINVPDSNALNKLLHVCNKVVQEYGQLPLYAKAIDESQSKKKSEPVKNNKKQSRCAELNFNWSSLQDLSDAFHVSIAWTLEPPSSFLLEATDSVSSNQFENTKKIALQVEEVKAKVGNVVTNMRLQRNVSEEKGLFGV